MFLKNIFILNAIKTKRNGFIITDSIIAVSILFLSMYLFSTFNNNTNAMLEQNKIYKELVYRAEIELNSTLDRIKKGDLKIESIENLNDTTIKKKIDLVDKNRGIYMVTIYANKEEKKVTLQGYEQWKEVR